MTAAASHRPSRAERMAKLLTHYDFSSLVSRREVDLDEAAFVTIGDPHRFRATERFAGGLLSSYADTCRMRMRAAAARAYLARRLARRAIHEGFAAAWRGTAREAFYEYSAHRRDWLEERAR